MQTSPFATQPKPAAVSGKTWTELYPQPADPWGSEPIDHGAYREAIRATIEAGRNPFSGAL